MTSSTTLKKRLAQRQAMLDACYDAYQNLISGSVKQYSIGSRSLTRFDIAELWDMIQKLEKEIDELETLLAGGGRRKASGVVPRDI